MFYFKDWVVVTCGYMYDGLWKIESIDELAVY